MQIEPESPFDNEKSAEELLSSPQPTKPAKPQVSEAKLFSQALYAFRKSNYADVITLLDTYLDMVPDHFFAIKLQAITLLYAGRLKDAKTGFDRAMTINKNDSETLNGLAYIALSNGETQAGINFLLDAIYVDEENMRLKRNLDKVRDMKDPRLFSATVKPELFLAITLPEQKPGEVLLHRVKEFFDQPLVKIAAILLIVLSIGLIIYTAYPRLSNAFESYRMSRMGIGSYKHISIRDLDELVSARQKYNIALSPENIKKKFYELKYYLKEGKRNQAIITANELLNSNAHESVKIKVDILREMAQNPDPQNIGYVPNCRDVIKAPFLYKDVYIKWNGTITHIQHKERKETAFDLLINLVDASVVDGIANVLFDGFQPLQNGHQVAVYGLITGISADNRIVIKGDKSIRLGQQ